MREYGSNINLPSLDNLFSSEQERQDAKLEKIQILPLTELHPFRNHPFQVRDDDEMDKMVESVKEYGVMTPAIVRPRQDGGYEIVAGHRRCHASQRAGVETMPCIVRDMDDDTAIILMVDSNCQREHILPSEKAKAYEMKLEAIRRKAGRPSKENSRQVVGDFESADLVGQASGESGRQVQRFIRLNKLTPELMKMVDEAHNFKNLMTVTKMHNIAGISTTESQKASDLFMKCQYLDEITGARGVTFATGTPISNSMTELYTMQRYLQQYTLERNGLANFDSWAATFGETVTAIELAPEGTGYRTKTRFARFFNLPELMAMFKECADIQTADMLKLPVPALVGGKPTNIQLKPSETQKQMVAELGERADKIRNKMVKPYEDNMLKITNDGRKLALDQRLIDPDLPDDPDSKVNICVGKIFEIWEQTMPQRSAQLVFCDLSTPKAGVFNVYDDMKAKLIERGIPETEIAFIHEANTDARKTELFGKVRSGAVRVLMGSTAKMGAGTNVQQRLVALHHLDVPWRPSDIEQREGRILRQGNENKEVYVFRYVTEGTFDAYSWQLIENKQKFIGQIMTSKSPARSCNDMDEAALSYAEVKALAAGNPLIKEKMDLDVQLTRLKTLKAAHDSQRYELENKIAIGFPAEIRKCKEQIENATVDAATVKEHSVVGADGKDVFCIQLEKKVYYEKEPAGKALLGLLGLALNSEKPVPIGYFKGMELQIQHLSFGNEYHARLAGSGTYSTQLGADVLGNLTRLSNLANGIEPSIEKTRNMQIQLEQQLASAEEEVKRPFPQATELTEKSKRLAVLEGLLNMNDKDIVTDTEPEQQCQTDNRQRGQEER